MFPWNLCQFSKFYYSELITGSGKRESLSQLVIDKVLIISNFSLFPKLLSPFAYHDEKGYMYYHGLTYIVVALIDLLFVHYLGDIKKKIMTF